MRGSPVSGPGTKFLIVRGPLHMETVQTAEVTVVPIPRGKQRGRRR
jgi:hypothetical protein